MKGVGRRVIYVLIVTGSAGVIRLLTSVPVAPAGGMAVHAVEFPGNSTGTQQPKGVRKILSQVTPIRIIVGMFERMDEEMIKESVTGRKTTGERRHLGVTGCTQIIQLS